MLAKFSGGAKAKLSCAAVRLNRHCMFKGARVPFNLITTPWIEVRRASGARAAVRPQDITDGLDADPILALDFPRPDWNAAVTEWLIGLTFLASPPEDAGAWADLFHAPPSPDALGATFAPLARHFNLDGDGPRAFQDFETLGNAEAKPLSGLLIDAPGENTLKNNADLFVKRGGAQTLSLAQAAAALITLQTYAPAGGAGHRTSLRGGGPLTTLVAPVREGAKVVTLWDRIWANVPDTDFSAPSAPDQVLPWLKPTLTSDKDGGPVIQEGRHLALAFFACPRRIRLIFEATTEGVVAAGYRTLNYGANYLLWRHPLSPYRNDKTSGKLPLHPNAGASDYGDWVAWWGFKDLAEPTPATCLETWNQRREQTGGLVDRTQVEAFGYDMDNMKARQWLEARLPWVTAHEGELRNAVSRLIAGSDESARTLRRAVKTALYGQRQDAGYRLPESLPIDTLPEPADRFWLETQAPFEALLDRVIDHLKDDTRAPTADYRREWLGVLRERALAIFDDAVDLDGMTDAEPRRLLHARGQLQFAFTDHPKAAVLKALDLLATVKPDKPARAPKTAKETAQ